MIIAIDYGESKCGFAIGERFILRSGTVKRKELDELLKDFKTVVLGVPLSMSGNYSTQSFKVLKYAEKLFWKGYEVFLYDERLTTKMASFFGIKDDDAFSARQIFLDYISNPSISQKFQVLKSVEKEIEAKGKILYVETLPIKNINGDALTKNYSLAYLHNKKGNFVFRNSDTIENKYDTVITKIEFKNLAERFLSESGVLIYN